MRDSSKGFSIERTSGWRAHLGWTAVVGAIATTIALTQSEPVIIDFSLLVVVAASLVVVIGVDSVHWPDDRLIAWLRHTPWHAGRPLPAGRPGPTWWVAYDVAAVFAFASGGGWLATDGFVQKLFRLARCTDGLGPTKERLLVAAGTGLIAVLLGLLLFAAAYGLTSAPAGEDRPRREVRKLHWALLLIGVWLIARREAYGVADATAIGLAAAVVLGMVACSVAGYWRAWRCLPRRVLEPPASGVVGFGGGVRQRRMLAGNGTLWPAPVAAEARPAWWITLAGGGLTALLAGQAAALAGAFVTTKAGDHDAAAVAVLVVAWGIAGIVLLGRVGWNRPGRATFGPPPPFRYLRRAGRTLTLPAWRAFWVGLIASLAACLLGDASGLRAPEVAGLTLAAAVFCAATLPPSRRWCELCGDGVIGSGNDPYLEDLASK